MRSVNDCKLAFSVVFWRRIYIAVVVVVVVLLLLLMVALRRTLQSVASLSEALTAMK